MPATLRGASGEAGARRATREDELMMISIVVAASTNNVIGVHGELPWRLPGDLQRFKTLTMSKPIIMGRRTYESIGRALPGRQNIVITRQRGYAADGCDVVQSTDAAIEAAGDAVEIMVIGGGDIYRQFLPRAHRIYLTRVEVELEGDTHFPSLDETNWQETAAEKHAADDSNEYDYSFNVLERVK
jgi:dihydrofolate reductase